MDRITLFVTTINNVPHIPYSDYANLLEENAHLRAEITELRARVVNGQAVDTDRS